MKRAIALAIIMRGGGAGSRWGADRRPSQNMIHRYDQINVMEGTLNGAVSLAANQVAPRGAVQDYPARTCSPVMRGRKGSPSTDTGRSSTSRFPRST